MPAAPRPRPKKPVVIRRAKFEGPKEIDLVRFKPGEHHVRFVHSEPKTTYSGKYGSVKLDAPKVKKRVIYR